jgi:hypothetical protein
MMLKHPTINHPQALLLTARNAIFLTWTQHAVSIIGHRLPYYKFFPVQILN